MKFRFLLSVIGLFLTMTAATQNDSITNPGGNLTWDFDIAYESDGNKKIEIKVYNDKDTAPVYIKYLSIRNEDDEIAVFDYLTLGAAFEEVTATHGNGPLTVSWRTATEANSKEFVVEGSADGQQWTALGKLGSKSSDGNSEQPLDYRMQLQPPLSFSAIGLSGLLLLTVARRRWMRVLVIVTAMISLGACSKKERLAENSRAAYVRIVQHEKDGTVGYSKTVKVLPG